MMRLNSQEDSSSRGDWIKLQRNKKRKKEKEKMEMMRMTVIIMRKKQMKMRKKIRDHLIDTICISCLWLKRCEKIYYLFG